MILIRGPARDKLFKFFKLESYYEDFWSFLLQFIALAGSPALFLASLAVLRRTQYAARVRSYDGGGWFDADRNAGAARGRLPMRRRPLGRALATGWTDGVSVRSPLLRFALNFGSPVDAASPRT